MLSTLAIGKQINMAKNNKLLQIKILSRLLEKKYHLFFDVHERETFS
jgi:hypothetical protein